MRHPNPRCGFWNAAPAVALLLVAFASEAGGTDLDQLYQTQTIVTG